MASDIEEKQRLRLQVLQEVQDYIDAHNIYRLTWPYYDYSNPNPYYWWHPLKWEKINIVEALNADKTGRPTLRKS